VVRKALVPLLSLILAVSMAACNSGAAQEDGKKTGSASQEPGSTEGGGQLTNIGRPAQVVFGSSYVSPLTEGFGDVFIGQEDFISASTALRAAPGFQVKLGNQSTIHDNVTVRAREDSVTIGDRTALAHHATVRDSEIGDSVYIGYNAEVGNSRVGNGAIIYHGAMVEGVEIPENSFVGAGEVVADQATADALPKVEEAGVDKYYTRDLLEVDQELRKGYIELYETEGYGAVMDIGPNPKTSFNPEEVEPQIDESVELPDFVRIVGDVQVGENSVIGRRTAIRADEGSPIVIGPAAIIDDRVTFHAIKGTDIQIGEYLVAGDDVVLHGPLQMGNDNVVGEGAVVFRARVGDNVQIGEGAVIAGPTGKELTLKIPDDTIIPGGAIVTSQEDLEALENKRRDQGIRP
jgi:carbonic anhydrase/acetyltransferase-like protein (isoleucine patch superfamily)